MVQRAENFPGVTEAEVTLGQEGFEDRVLQGTVKQTMVCNDDGIHVELWEWHIVLVRK